MSHTTCWNWNCYLRVVISVFLTCNVYLHGIAILGNQCTWDVKLFSIFTFEIQRVVICFSITLLTGGTRLMEVENIFCFAFFFQDHPLFNSFYTKESDRVFSKYDHCIVSKNDQPKLSMFHTPYLGARPFSHHFKRKMHSYHTTTKTRCLFFL